ncbi:histidine kinase N-terminal domain-containing protein [Demequina litorisediminis]|uniref:Histidine kinase PdtaS GAF domain-containing protein n=1 Tax=Demequina litorisediminis TaxID=1849022 RepID=A0ABQ6IF08_9MICO|nr:hypothetical protein GCM10025876_26770 [Demequina litorisediminis]
MATLRETAEKYAPLTDAEAEWLALLTADWQIIADLSFADLVMWHAVDDGFVAIAQCRPSTGPTVHQDDVVGTMAAPGRVAHLQRALDEGGITASREPRWDETYAVREDALPIVMDGRRIAVLTREVSQAVSRSSSRLELNYKGAADDLLHMITRGEFPTQMSVTGSRRGAPRVGDGVVRLDAAGHVTYASPNALSCFHRLGVTGSLMNRSLPRVTSEPHYRQGTHRRDARDGGDGARALARRHRGQRCDAVHAGHPRDRARRAHRRRAAVPRRLGAFVGASVSHHEGRDDS